MSDEKKVKQSVIRLQKGDITDLEIDAFVYYAQPDLKLGSGFGNAIAVRGGPKVQKELETFGTVNTGDAVVTAGGKLKAKSIIHAVGPRFGEEGTEDKLRTTVLNALKQAEEKGIEKIAFPPMGAGFYGIPLDLCARVMLRTIKEYLEGETRIKEVVLCLMDLREYQPFQAQLAAVG